MAGKLGGLNFLENNRTLIQGALCGVRFMQKLLLMMDEGIGNFKQVNKVNGYSEN